MKVYVNLLLIFLLIELQSHVFCAAPERTNYEYGNREKGDKLITKGYIRVEPGRKTLGVFSVTVDGFISFDLKKKLQKKITDIKLYQKDEKKFKTGRAAVVKILKGGVGSKHVKLRLTSLEGLGLSYEVLVYGK